MKRKIDTNSANFLRLVDSTYDYLLHEIEKGNEEVKFILSTPNFWKAKYLKDFKEPNGQVKSWRKAYEEQFALNTPKYKQLMSMTYNDLVEEENYPNNKEALPILESDNFWKAKYYRDYKKRPEHDVENWKEEYRNAYFDTIINERIDDIFEIVLNDIIAVRAAVYERYYRGLSREMRSLGYQLGGCRMRKSEPNDIKPESQLEQAWLLDNDDERSKKLQEEKLLRVFKHYYQLTTQVKHSQNEYYGALLVALTFVDDDYIFGTPHIKNEGIVYDRGYEPKSVQDYMNTIMNDEVPYIYIYVFCSPEGKEISNWVIKTEDDNEVGFENVGHAELRQYLTYIIAANTIFPIVTRTLENLKHTSRCGPWLV